MKRFSKLMNNSKTSTFLMIVFVVLIGVLLYLLFGRRLIEGVGRSNPFVKGPKQNPVYNTPPSTPTLRRKDTTSDHVEHMNPAFFGFDTPPTLRRNQHLYNISPASSPLTLRRKGTESGHMNPAFGGFDTQQQPSYIPVDPDSYPPFQPVDTPPSTPEPRRRNAGNTRNEDEVIKMYAVGAANKNERIAMELNPYHPLHGVTLRRPPSRMTTTESEPGYQYVPNVPMSQMSSGYLTPGQQISGIESTENRYLIPGQQLV